MLLNFENSLRTYKILVHIFLQWQWKVGHVGMHRRIFDNDGPGRRSWINDTYSFELTF